MVSNFVVDLLPGSLFLLKDYNMLFVGLQYFLVVRFVCFVCKVLLPHLILESNIRCKLYKLVASGMLLVQV